MSSSPTQQLGSTSTWDFVRARSAWSTYARVATAAVGLLATTLLAPDQRAPFFAGLGFYLALALVGVLVHRRGLTLHVRLGVFLVLDQIAAGSVVWALGTAASLMPVLYSFIVVAYTVRGGSRFGLVATVSSILCYVAIVQAEIAGLLPAGPLASPLELDWRVSASLLATVLVFCYIFLHATFGQLHWNVNIARSLWQSERQARERSEGLQRKLGDAARLESLGRLTGGIAHDFNNMLTSIMGHAEFARDELPAGAGVRKDLDAILSVSKRAAMLTAQLLAFSRNQVVNARRLELNDIVSKSGETLGRLIGEDIRTKLELASDSTAIAADRAQIEQVLLTLAVNARDAMPDGGLLHLSTDVVELEDAGPGMVPGTYVRLTVRDTGTGIPPEVLPRIFEPFFTTKATGKGTGMGLAAAYGWVKQNAGTIEVHSSLGEGTSFTMLFPRAEEVPEVLERNGTSTGGTVLVVEDDAAVRHLARRMLESAGYGVLEAADGERALNLAAQADCTIDVLLTDVIMPGLTGKALADKLRCSRPNIGVVYMSGYTGDALARHGLADDIDLVAKPFASRDLLECVRRALGNGGRTSLDSSGAEL